MENTAGLREKVDCCAVSGAAAAPAMSAPTIKRFIMVSLTVEIDPAPVHNERTMGEYKARAASACAHDVACGTSAQPGCSRSAVAQFLRCGLPFVLANR